ncbi:MAG: RdgB/HAM1 family non-canonical purine NTP pyrophosphatase [Actinobacteria bacterium]|nr:RdgB/HAM1 family non-canonical purine NTP pyrophosphatase [Actinomycetota bacterium]
MEALFVTSNPNKAREAAEILGVEMRSVGLDLPELQALDVAQVAVAKAAAARATLGDPDSPVLVEDSGLVIDAWNGLPGALTKWFLRSVGNEGLVKMLSGEENRSARAVCAVAIALADGSVHVFVGEVEGNVAPEPRGSGGFGWDPIFVPEGYTETYAELGPRKHEVSHRARALAAARQALRPGPEASPSGV